MKYTALLSIFMFGSATIGLPNELLRDGEDTRESEQNSSARIPASEASLGIGVVSKSQRGEIAYLQRRFDILECWDAHKDDDWGQWECNGIKFFREQPYPYGLSPSHCWNEANRGIRRALADVGERTWQTECCTSLNIPVKPKTWVPVCHTGYNPSGTPERSTCAKSISGEDGIAKRIPPNNQID